MMMRISVVSVFVLIVLVGLVSGATTNKRSFVSTLGDLQTSSGGFVDFNDTNLKATVEATSDAMFLGSFFSLPYINRTTALQFVNSLYDEETGGFANARGEGPSLEGTRAAVIAFAQVGYPAPKPEQTGAYLRRFEGSNDLRVLLSVFETAELLGLLEEEWVTQLSALVRDVLDTRITGQDQTSYFMRDSSALDVEAAHYNQLSLSLSQYVGVQLDELSEWAEYWVRLQDPTSGCFFSGPESARADLPATVDAIRSLYILQRLSHRSGSQLNFLDLINLDALNRCIQVSTEGSISSVARSHLILAMTPVFSGLFKTTWSYQVLNAGALEDDKNIVQGTMLRPSVSVRSDFGIHALMNIAANIHQEGKEPIRYELAFNREMKDYRTEEVFDTTDFLGPVGFYYVVEMFVPTLGAVRYIHTDQRLIGYGLNIDASATHVESGITYEAGNNVIPGTSFRFEVEPFVHSGELDTSEIQIDCLVSDSSGIVIHSDLVDAAMDGEDGEEAEGVFAFEYALGRDDLPAGPLKFEFRVEGVREDGSPFMHTNREVNYVYQTEMVAENVIVEEATLQLGDVLRASTRPACTQDGALLRPFEFLERRTFLLDLLTAGGNVVQSVRGSPRADGSVSFELPLEASVHLVGKLNLRFRYQATDGESVVLHPYRPTDAIVDLETDVSASVTVAGQLELELDEASSLPASLLYGQTVSTGFILRDALTGQKLSGSGLHLRISSDSTVSVDAPIEHDINGWYAVEHQISANAVPGASKLSIEVENADGESTELYSQAVEVGGTIEHEDYVYSTNSLTASHTAFLGIFKLICNGVTLTDANLQANVRFNNQPLSSYSSLPVATTPSGLYSVSFNIASADAASGLYEIVISRQTDNSHVFSRTIQHENPADQQLPIRSEWIALLLLFFALYRIYNSWPSK